MSTQDDLLQGRRETRMQARKPSPAGKRRVGKQVADADAARYEQDFARWATDQANAIRAHEFHGLDIENLADEIEDMARRERDEIESRLIVLLIHLLKWRHQASHRSGSWRATMSEQRDRIARRIEISPSLRSYPAQSFPDAYRAARRRAADETELPIDCFPVEAPFALEQVLDLEYFPEAYPSEASAGVLVPES